MSGSLTTTLITPTQAADIYSNSQGFPKQKNVFLVRFNKSGSISTSATLMTYAIKSVDRPSIQPTSEELNQYNKKRQVFTGYKKSPIKCTFYDDAQGSAQSMWADYSRYYFGDFATGNDGGPFFDDITGSTFANNGSDFGFTSFNGGNPSPGSQWYFTSINILHFHNTIYDLYTLVNPKIIAFEPDDLDFEQSGISMINTQFVYEAIIFTPNYGTASSAPEFSAQYNGNTSGTQADYTSEPGNTSPTSTSILQTAYSSVEQLFGGTSGLYPSSTSLPDYRYYSSAATGGLGVFGNFIYGTNNPNSISGSTSATALSSLAQSNPALAATLGLGSNTGNPLAVNAPLNVYGTTAGYVGAPPQLQSVGASVVSSMTGNYGNIGSQIAGGIVGANLINGAGANSFLNGSGLTLSPAALSVINAQNPGAVQYGYNGNTTPFGTLYGYQGATGVTGPSVGSGLGTSTVPTIDATSAQTTPDAQIIQSPTVGTTTSTVTPVTATPLPDPANSTSSSDESGPEIDFSITNPIDPNSGVDTSDDD